MSPQLGFSILCEIALSRFGLVFDGRLVSSYGRSSFAISDYQFCIGLRYRGQSHDRTGRLCYLSQR